MGDELVHMARFLAAEWQREQLYEQAKRDISFSTLAREQLLLALSHELRTPLTSLIGNSGLLQQTMLDGGQQTLLKGVESASSKILSALDDLLNTASIEFSDSQVERYPFDLSQLLDELRQQFQARLTAAENELVINSGISDDHYYIGDAQHLRQVLANLMGNASRATLKGKISLQIEARGEEQCAFIFEDEGAGLQKEIMQLLNSPDSLKERSHLRCGSAGLGILISSGLAIEMGGSLQVGSREQRGDRVELLVPLHRGEKKEAPQTQSENQYSASRFEGSVLVADDALEIQSLIRRRLEKLGVTVTTVSDGVEAVECASRDHFNLILMDYRMPLMNGIDATRQLKQVGVKAPVVMLAAEGLVSVREQSKRWGHIVCWRNHSLKKHCSSC